MVAELRRLVEHEIHILLCRQGPRPQMLAEARLDYRRDTYRTVLMLILCDGTEWHSLLPDRGPPASGGAGDARLFSRDCVRLYSEMYEDYLLELELRRAGENLRELVVSCTDQHVIDEAFRHHRDFEAHARRHHRIRRDNPMMPVPLDSYTSQVAPGPEGALTIESMQRAMELLRRHVPRYYDDRGAFGVAVLGVDWAADERTQVRALALFKERLSPAQRAQYEERRHFEVIGSDSGKRYRIRHGRQMNIDELDAAGERVCGWCFLPQGGLAAGDVMLGQKIALECDEAAALKVANRFGF